MVETSIVLKMRRHRHSHGTSKTKHYRAVEGRHENKSVRIAERAIKKVREEKGLLDDLPIPLIDIGIDRISDLIKSITGINEDAFQQAWVKVLEDHCKTEDDILKYARQSVKETWVHNYPEISLQSPVKINDYDSTLTLLDTIESPEEKTDEEIEHDIETNNQYIATSTGKINRQGNTHLDLEVMLAIRKRFPHDPINHAVRKLVNMPPPSRMKLGWHKWEDELIKVRYPWGGARALTLDLNRTMGAINSRAQYLKVRAGATLNSYKPIPEWLNIQDVVEKTGRSESTITRYINEGIIEAIRIPGYHQGHDGVFVTPESFERFRDRKEIIKKERRQKGAETRLKKMAESKLIKRESRVMQKEVSIKTQEAILAKERRKLQSKEKAIAKTQEAILAKERRLRDLNKKERCISSRESRINRLMLLIKDQERQQVYRKALSIISKKINNAGHIPERPQVLCDYTLGGGCESRLCTYRAPWARIIIHDYLVLLRKSIKDEYEKQPNANKTITKYLVVSPVREKSRTAVPVT